MWLVALAFRPLMTGWLSLSRNHAVLEGYEGIAVQCSPLGAEELSMQVLDPLQELL